MSEVLVDRSDFYLPRRLKAAHEIAQAELERSDVYEPISAGAKTLGRFEMFGEWDATDQFEHTIYPDMAILLNQGYNGMFSIGRGDEEAKVAITIPAGLTAEDGYVALRRKRRLMMLTSTTMPLVEVDKISMFALDINKLAVLSADAVSEVRLIVAGAMYLALDSNALLRDDFAINPEEEVIFEYLSNVAGQSKDEFVEALEDLKQLRAALKRYDIKFTEIENRLRSTKPTQLHDPSSIQFIEQAIIARSELLTPAATTYYAHS